MGQAYSEFPVWLLHALGVVFGPMLIPIVLTRLLQDSEGRRDYFRRLTDFRRIGAGWYGVVLLVFPLLSGLAALTDTLGGGAWPSFETAAGLLASPSRLLSFAVFTLFFGPIPEELGWRGYALDRLQAKRSALSASLILGVLWWLWHLPLYFIAGTYQHSEVGFGTLRFWLGSLSVVALSILMTWIYNNTDRSTLSAVLVHFIVNFTGEFLNLLDRAEYYAAMWTVIAAMVVTAIWGPASLAPRWQGAHQSDNESSRRVNHKASVLHCLPSDLHSTQGVRYRAPFFYHLDESVDVLRR
ncbi:MAG: CPBP family intramembrane metalloprotease [Firmicutes bacterium]|nr:CPBP family intramembrane metalloprotease [Bacillota bacterium]